MVEEVNNETLKCDDCGSPITVKDLHIGICRVCGKLLDNMHDLNEGQLQRRHEDVKRNSKIG